MPSEVFDLRILKVWGTERISPHAVATRPTRPTSMADIYWGNTRREALLTPLISDRYKKEGGDNSTMANELLAIVEAPSNTAPRSD